MENQKTFKISGDLMCSIIANDARIGIINSYRNFLIDCYNANIDEIHAGNIDDDVKATAKLDAIEVVINDLFKVLQELEQETNKIIDDNEIPTLDFTKLSDIEVPIKDEYKKTVPVFVEEGVTSMQESRVDWIKKGKAVKIRDWKSMEDEFGVDRDGDIDCPVSFTRLMLSLCGRVIIITAEMQRSYNSHGYFLVYDENAQSWMITDDMIEPVED